MHSQKQKNYTYAYMCVCMYGTAWMRSEGTGADWVADVEVGVAYSFTVHRPGSRRVAEQGWCKPGRKLALSVLGEFTLTLTSSFPFRLS